MDVDEIAHRMADRARERGEREGDTILSLSKASIHIHLFLSGGFSKLSQLNDVRYVIDSLEVCVCTHTLCSSGGDQTFVTLKAFSH